MATEPACLVPGVWSLTGCGGFLVNHHGAFSFSFHEELCQAACAPRVDGTVGGWQGACRRQALHLGPPTCLHG